MSQLYLERVVGTSNSLVASHATGIGWLAGNYAVLATPKQQVLVKSRTNRPLTALSFSSCGSLVAIGESYVVGGPSPEIELFDLTSCDFTCKWYSSTLHTSSVSTICFSSQGLIATLGANDLMLQLFDVRTGQSVAKLNLDTVGLKGCTFTEDGNSIITCGKGSHFKVWSISKGSSTALTQRLASKQVSFPKDLRSTSFVAVASAVSSSSALAPPSSGGIYALTSDGNLILMRATGRSVSHHVNLQVSRAFDLSVSPSLVACACDTGLVRLFDTKLKFQSNLPRPPPSVNNPDFFSDAVSLSFSPSISGDTSILAVAYEDREIIVYDVKDVKKLARLRIFSSHSSGIFAVKVFNDTLVTSSADGSIKCWNHSQAQTLRGPEIQKAAIQKQQGLGHQNSTIGRVNWSRAGTKEDTKRQRGLGDPPANKCSVYCLDASADGSVLAAGDEQGNIQVFDLVSKKLLAERSLVHDLSIQTIALSSNKRFLASGGRDGLIHLFELTGNGLALELVDTADEHNGHSVTGLRFDHDTSRLLSCGADRTFVVHTINDCSLATGYKDQPPPFLSSQAVKKNGAGAFLDLALDQEGRLVVVAASDSTLRLYDVLEMRAVGSICLQHAEQPVDGAPLPVAVRVALDPTGTIAFCSLLDGSIQCYYLPNGALLAASHGGHGGVASSFVVSSDLSSLVSVGGDGVIMRWRIPFEIQKRLSAQPLPLADTTPVQDVSKSLTRTEMPVISSTLMRVQQGRLLLSVDKLPRWARPALPSFDLDPSMAEETELPLPAPLALIPQAASEVAMGPQAAPQEVKKLSFIQRVLNLRLKSKKKKATDIQPPDEVVAAGRDQSLLRVDGTIAGRDQSLLRVDGTRMSIGRMDVIQEDKVNDSHWADSLDDQVVIFSASEEDKPDRFTVKEACDQVEGEEESSAAGSSSVHASVGAEDQGQASGETGSITLPPRDLFKEHYPEIDETGRPSEASVCNSNPIDPRRQSLSTTYRLLALSILKDRRKQAGIKETIMETEIMCPQEEEEEEEASCIEDLPLLTPILVKAERKGGKLEAELARMRERLQSLNKRWDHARKTEKTIDPAPIAPSPAAICGLTPPDANTFHPPLPDPVQGGEGDRSHLQDNPMFNSSTPLSTFSLTPPPMDGQIFSFDHKLSKELDRMEDDGDSIASRVLMGENAAFVSMERGGEPAGSPSVPQDRGRPLPSPGPSALPLGFTSPSNFQVSKRPKVSTKLPPFKRASPVKTSEIQPPHQETGPAPLTEFKTRQLQQNLSRDGNLCVENIEIAIDADDSIPRDRKLAMDQDAYNPSDELSSGLDQLELAAMEMAKLWSATVPRSEAHEAKLMSVVSLLQGLSRS